MTRVAGASSRNRSIALDAVQARHDEVHEHDVGLQGGDGVERGLAVGRLADDLDVVLQLEERPQALAHDRVVVDDEDADHAGTRRRTVVPAPGAESISQRAADVAGALGHRREAEPARAHLVGSKPTPSSATVSSTRSAVAAQAHVDPRAGAGVAQRVVQRLLRDAEDVGLDRAGAVAGDVEVDRAAVRAAQDVDVLGERDGEPLGFERGRAQVDDDRAQLLHRLAGEVARELHLLARCRDVAVEQRAAGLGREHDPEELLRDRVVQLAREAVSLLDDRELAAALVQPRVLDRERGVRGERLDERLVVVGEAARACR